MKILLKFVLLLLIGISLAGCGEKQETKVEKVADLKFTVVENEKIPEELMTMIEEKKTQVFKITYGNEDDFYMVVGYGRQKTGGYSIRVNECYQSKNAVIFDTELLGPMQDETVEKAETYPYIVVKIKNPNLPVVFE